jgi:hypothetical protein
MGLNASFSVKSLHLPLYFVTLYTVTTEEYESNNYQHR